MDFTVHGFSGPVAILEKEENLLVKFFQHPEISKTKSQNAGVPVYDNIEMISVIQPGEKEEIKVMATEWHRRRFPKQYAAFKAGQEMVASGTPLDHLFPSEPGTVLTLKSFNVYTVQQLAGLPDSAISSMPMGRQLVDKAKAYLSSADSGADFHKLNNRVAELEAMLAAREAVAEVSVTAGTGGGEVVTTEPARRGPGRPPRAA